MPAISWALREGQQRARRQIGSQSDGLGADPFVSWLEPARGEDVNVAAQQILQVLGQMKLVK